MNKSIQFFDIQFQRQVRDAEFALNPFERMALAHLNGRVLDLGCGLGNLSIAAAQTGCTVVALDASPAGIERLRAVAKSEGLPIEAGIADLENYRIQEEFDTIVCIGLLMFMKETDAHRLLNEILEHVCPGGRAVVNVLIEGTTFMGMFDPGCYYLFGQTGLVEAFADWEILESSTEDFDAPGNTVKRFSTVIATRPQGNQA